MVAGQYKYMDDLLALDACRPTFRVQLPARASTITTPLKLDAWAELLARHPDKVFVAYILEGIQLGFRIGFDYANNQCHSAKKNMQSAADTPHVVARYLEAEYRLGRVITLVDIEARSVQTSPFGVIPKRGTANGWRLILDLSSPPGHSINEGIDPAKCSLKYALIEQAVQICRSMGEAPLLSKLDIKSAYRMVPVHPDDRHLLGMRWRGNLYVDTTIPFGLRSVPKVFSAVADALL